MGEAYAPPCRLSAAMLSLTAGIAERVGRLQAGSDDERQLRLRRVNRIRTVHGTLAIEGNALNRSQITAILDGRRVLAPPREVQEVRNALQAYDRLSAWEPGSEDALLGAHGLMMHGLVDRPGSYRSGGVGVMDGSRVIHMAPPASRVPVLMAQLFAWLGRSDLHPLVTGCLFHYELEFIHPFEDGNGRMGRLWQTLILSRWRHLFGNLPIESLVHAHQPAYYDAIAASNADADAAPFVEFMLPMIQQALDELDEADEPPDAAAPVGVTGERADEHDREQDPQLVRDHAPSPAASGAAAPDEKVERLLEVLARGGPGATKALMASLGLSHRPSFLYRYLRPALDGGWVEMTDPARPKSPHQRYRLSAEGFTFLEHRDPADRPTDRGPRSH